MRFPRSLAPVALWLAAAALMACGDDDGAPRASTANLPTATQAAVPTPGSSAVPNPALTPTSVSTARASERDPRFYIYEASAGDTLQSVSAVVNGQPGSAKAGLPDQIRLLNRLGSDTFVPGQQLVVPLLVASDQALTPQIAIEAAIGAGGKGGPLQLLEPGSALRESYKGRLVLGMLKISDGNPQSEGFGYLMRYALADRPPLKGGTRDPDAMVVDDAFTVAGGSLVAELERRAQAAGAPTASFSRNGVAYLVAGGRGAELTPQRIAEMLEAAGAR